MLLLKFTDQQSFDTGFTCLNGNAFKFDNYKSELTLKLFTTESATNAVLQMATHGLIEGTNFSREHHA
jgi:hypothetical protein